MAPRSGHLGAREDDAQLHVAVAVGGQARDGEIARTGETPVGVDDRGLGVEVWHRAQLEARHAKGLQPGQTENATPHGIGSQRGDEPQIASAGEFSGLSNQLGNRNREERTGQPDPPLCSTDALDQIIASDVQKRTLPRSLKPPSRLSHIPLRSCQNAAPHTSTGPAT